MTQHRGYSDRIAHALAFAAKHGPGRTGGRGPTIYPTRPAGVALVLARYGADEITIVAGVLSALLQEVPIGTRGELELKIGGKFGDTVAQVVRCGVEPVLDARGRERHWEARKLDLLAELAAAEPRVLEVCAAREIYACGALLSEVRRLGVEYLGHHTEGGAPALCRWFTDLVVVLERHPVGPRPGMVAELRELAQRLAEAAGPA